MELVNAGVTKLIQERDGVMAERRQALTMWANASGAAQKWIYYEFVQPLNEQLLKLNKRLGI